MRSGAVTFGGSRRMHVFLFERLLVARRTPSAGICLPLHIITGRIAPLCHENDPQAVAVFPWRL